MCDILKKYVNGKISRKEISKYFTPQQLCKKLKKEGYSLKTHIYTSQGFILKTSKVWTKYHDLYLKNKVSLKEIGDSFGVSSEKISTLFKELNFTQKDPEQIKKAAKKTCLKKYGVDNPSKSEVIKNKKASTSFKNYGVDNPSKDKGVKEKIRKKNLEKYNVNSFLEIKEIQNKGVLASQEKNIKEKRKNTLKEKTGYETPFSNPDTQKEIKQILLNKYGRGNAMHIPEFKKKLKQTNNLKYDVDYCLQNKDIRKKSLLTRLNNKTQEILQELEQYNYTLLGSYKGLQEKQGNRHLSWKQYNIKHNPCGNIFKDDLFRLPRCPQCFPLNEKRSYLEYLLEDFINQELKEKVTHKTNFLKNKNKSFDLDLYIEEKKIGFEINGLYYHSLHNMKNNSVFDKNYHLNKTKLAKKQGINLYYFWEHHDLNLIKSGILHILGYTKNKIGARKTNIKEISFKEAQSFLNKNHFYGSTSSFLNLGLFYNSECLQVISFRKTQNKSSVELARFASKQNYQIQGGFSKLLKASIKYLKNLKYKEILSYCHRDQAPSQEDTIYYKVGFSFMGETKPSLYFTDFRKVYSRQTFQKHKLAKLFPESYNPKLSALDNLALNKIYPLYDSGNWKYIYKIK